VDVRPTVVVVVIGSRCVSGMRSKDLQIQLDNVVLRLAGEFSGVFGRETVRRLVDETVARWPSARIAQHLPVLTYRFARERLRAFGQAEGTIEKMTPEVLFVCVHNAGRSQMAAGLLDKHAHGRVHVRSAGSTPADTINPAVVAAMEEVGVDLSTEFPKPLSDEFVRAADVVVTMGCGDACPVFPGIRYLDWDLDDPSGLTVEQVRPIRDEIDRRVRALLEEIVPSEEIDPVAT
jgi:protein-tyrosine-phosphatase